jgi:hypothetical protein
MGGWVSNHPQLNSKRNRKADFMSEETLWGKIVGPMVTHLCNIRDTASYGRIESYTAAPYQTSTTDRLIE